MSTETKLMLAVAAVLVYALAYAFTRVLSAWSEHHLSRHDLIVASKQRRLDYLRAVAERRQLEEAEEAEGNDTVIIDDDEPAELAQAA